MPDIWISLFKTVGKLSDAEAATLGRLVVKKIKEKWDMEGYGTEENKTYVEISVGAS